MSDQYSSWPEERARRRKEKNKAFRNLKEQMDNSVILQVERHIPDESLIRDSRERSPIIRGGYEALLISNTNIDVELNPSPKFTVVSYYTKDTGYQDEVQNLIKSIERFNLAYYIEGIDNLGSWQANTHFKAKFIRKALDWITTPILFLDADARIQQYPYLFNEIEADFGAYFKPDGGILSGTLYFNNNDKMKSLLDAWIIANSHHISRWEQQVLSEVIQEQRDNLSIFELPPTYCQIFDLMKDAGQPVIEHFQASRRYKKAVENPYKGKLAILVPTKGRPQSIIRLVESVLRTAADPSRIRFFLCIPADDQKSRAVIEVMNNKSIFIIDEPDCGEVNLSVFWNTLYDEAKKWANFFGFYGDDVEFQTQNWDNQVVAEFRKHEGRPWLVRTNDKYQPDMATLFFTNKILHELVGYYMPEYYRNVAMDTHWSEITREAGCRTFLDGVITYHHSVILGRAPEDETRLGCRKHVKEDTELFHGDEQKRVRTAMVKKIRDYMAK